MKVVKPGASTWKKKATCKPCGATLEYTPEDVKMGDFGCGYGDDHDFKTYIDCPECKSAVFVRVPDWISEMASAKRRSL